VKTRVIWIAVGGLYFALLWQSPVSAQARQFDVASGGAERSLPEFARQAGIQVLAPGDQLDGVFTPAVKGTYDVFVALHLMLRGTDLMVSRTAEGIVMISSHSKNRGQERESMLKGSYTKVSIIALSTSLLGLSPAFAQSGETMETVVVSGIRGALEKAENRKREASVVLDGLSTDDIGQMPDTSISESLMRITGVTSNDTARGSDQVAIRGLGPDMALTTYNGRVLPTADPVTRRVGLAGLPTEGLSGAEVQKTPEAATIEGAVAGILGLNPVKPLTTSKEGLTVVARGIFDQFAANLSGLEGTMPLGARGELSYVKAFTPHFGVALSLSYLKQSNAQLGVQSQNWQYGTTTRADLNGDRIVDALPGNGGAMANVFLTERPTVMGMVQWQPSNFIGISADFLISRDHYKNYTHRYYATNIFNGTLGAPASATVVNNAVVAFNGTVALYHGNASNNDLRDHTKQFGLNFDINPAGHLSGTVDVYYANAGRDRTTPGIDFENAAATAVLQRRPFSYSFDGHESATFNFTNGDLGPDSYSVQAANYATETSEDTVKALRADMMYDAVPLSFIRDVRFGVRLDVRKHSRDVDASQYTWATVPARPLLNSSLLLRSSNPMSKYSNILGGPSAVNFPLYDIEKTLDYARKSAGVVLNDQYTSDLATNAVVSEHTGAVYVQADIEAGKLTGNVGLRWVQTGNTVTGQAGTKPANTVDRVFKHTADWLLPSLNLRYALPRDLYARFGVSRSISRPQFNDLRVGAAVDLTTAPTGQVTIAQGNPNLQPYTSDSIDAGLEWYPDESTFVSVSYFDKRVKNFTRTATQSSTVALEDGTIVPAQITMTVNDPAPKHFRGFEVQFRENFDFLPGLWSGLGIQGNYNHNDTDARDNFTSLIGYTAPVLPVNFSRDAVNAQVFYDHGKINARLAYRFQTGYSRTMSNGYQYQPNGYLDFNLTYRLPKYKSALFFTATNLTGAGVYRTTVDLRDQYNLALTQNISVASRTFIFGFRKNF
jgi:TonB-dependent receptor